MTKKKQEQTPDKDELQEDVSAQAQVVEQDEPVLEPIADARDDAETGAEQEEEQGDGTDDKFVKVRVLVDCQIGKCNDVVEIKESDLTGLAGQVDADPSAVAYAESLSE